MSPTNSGRFADRAELAAYPHLSDALRDVLVTATELDQARDQRDLAILAAWRAGASAHNIAIAAGLSRQAVYKYIGPQDGQNVAEELS